jgi:hypothetical protein
MSEDQSAGDSDSMVDLGKRGDILTGQEPQVAGPLQEQQSNHSSVVKPTVSGHAPQGAVRTSEELATLSFFGKILTPGDM